MTKQCFSKSAYILYQTSKSGKQNLEERFLFSLQGDVKLRKFYGYNLRRKLIFV